MAAGRSGRTRRMALVNLGPVCGLLASMSFLVGFLVAILLDPGWRVGAFWLSDLGVRQGAWAYNTGVVLGGLLTIPFALSARHLLAPGRLTRLGSTLFVVAGIAQVGVGVFTEHTPAMHLVFAFVLFTAVPLGWIVLALPMHRTPAFGGFGGVLSLIALGIVLVAGRVTNRFTAEAIGVFTAVAWAILVSAVLLLRHPAVPPPKGLSAPPA